LRWLFLVAAVLVAAATVFIATVFIARVPPKHLTLADPAPDQTIPGVLHVHSVRSDGRGTADEIAEAAAQAGLKFVIVTDHGDGTRTPEAPVYRRGVLCLDAVEISTSGGHYIALDMPASPYPLGGEARDVVEDVKRLGGFGLVAHPDSPKDELRWREWGEPFDALEIVNLDTAWRQRAAGASWRQRVDLATRLLSYPIRPAESIASLVQPSTIWDRWAALARRRHLVTLPGADAHARIGWRTGDPVAGSMSAPLPSYLTSFRTLSVHVRTERALTGNAGFDARMIIRAIRAGHSYTAMEGAASPASFDFTATNDRGTVHAGDEISAGGTLTLRVRSNAPPGFTTTIWNGTELVSGDHHQQDVSVELPEGDGVYRAEIRATGQFPSLPWIVSNAIYVRIPGANTPAIPTAVTTPDTALALFDGRTLTGWKVEQDATSLGAVDVAETGTTRQPALRWRFGLSSGMPSSQFAALLADLPNGAASGDRVTFTARAERPMRISIQLRAGSDRWQRSVYLDIFNRQRTVLFSDLRPAGAAATDKPPLADVRSLMFVVDATNTKPGTSGRIWIARPALQR
jgi:hypothetical protein